MLRFTTIHLTLFVMMMSLTSCIMLDTSIAEQYGTIGIALKGNSPSGKTYRLRDAVFTIERRYSSYGDAGLSYLELSTEDDPDAEKLRATAVPGRYSVTLEEGWRIEEVDANGQGTTVNAVILSDQTQYVRVYSKQTSSVWYDFGIGDEIIQFRQGNIDIRIRIEDDAGVDDAGVDDTEW